MFSKASLISVNAVAFFATLPPVQHSLPHSHQNVLDPQTHIFLLHRCLPRHRRAAEHGSSLGLGQVFPEGLLCGPTQACAKEVSRGRMQKVLGFGVKERRRGEEKEM